MWTSSDLIESPGRFVGHTYTLSMTAPCLDGEVEREAVRLYQLSCPVLEGGGPAVPPERALGCLLYGLVVKLRQYLRIG